ncbi:MAG TPA: TPM domain-containing protein [Chthoniobacterales bacterium]
MKRSVTQSKHPGEQPERARRAAASPRGILGYRCAALATVFLFLAIAGQVAAEKIPAKPAGYFNDYANVVDRQTALQLNEKLAQFERETSTQLLVAVYQTMESDSDVADYTQRVAQTWGVGQKGHNNGAVLFVFVHNHQMFIQTGYGLEGALPDATCFDITHNVVAPHFKQNDYAGGLEAGVNAMMQAVRGEYKGSGKTHKEATKGKVQGFPLGAIIVVLIVIFIIMSRFRRTVRRGYGYSGWGGPFIGGFGGGGWSGGGGGFSGFSGGGGSFGGGGAGSSW